MPFWIEGWIEVCRSSDVDNESAWVAVVNLGPLIDAADAVSEEIFGLSKDLAGGSRDVQSLAAQRGLPKNMSAGVKEAVDRIRAHESKFGPGEFGGYTYATWAEIQEHNVSALDLAKSDWWTAFEIASCLEQWIAADRIRFVVWFNW